ncbi:MAG: response regulator [Myxococcales bacterium]|nr:response regulator [Myxococcales bacterium]
MGIRVMVVDDSRSARRAVCDVLVLAGFEVTEAIDGQDALAQLATTTGLSLILLDVNMPGKNGVQVLREIRELDGESRLVPVVMLTTEGQPNLIREARSAGAKAWLVKPFDPVLLVAAVSKLAA